MQPCVARGRLCGAPVHKVSDPVPAFVFDRMAVPAPQAQSVNDAVVALGLQDQAGASSSTVAFSG
jgi:hypothetical protein